jgi:hypothetical protein
MCAGHVMHVRPFAFGISRYNCYFNSIFLFCFCSIIPGHPQLSPAAIKKV